MVKKSSPNGQPTLNILYIGQQRNLQLGSAVSVISRTSSQICEEKIPGPQTTQIVLDHWLKIAAIPAKQATRLQSNPETYLNLWCTIVRISI